MFHVKAENAEETKVHLAKVKLIVKDQMPDAEDILRYLAANEVKVQFVAPGGASKAFNSAAADAGSLSVLDNRIFIDARKLLEQQANDLARRTCALMAAPKPNRLERFLHDRVGIVYGRMMRLENRDGINP
jgi:hypothetical protein